MGNSNYCVEAAETLRELVAKVNERLSEGYQCVGGIAATNYERVPDCQVMYFYQAMVKQ